MVAQMSLERLLVPEMNEIKDTQQMLEGRALKVAQNTVSIITVHDLILTDC